MAAIDNQPRTIAEYQHTLRLLQGSYLDPFVLVDIDGCVLSFNRAFLGLFDRRQARHLDGARLGDVLALVFREEPLDLLSNCLSRSASVRYDEVVALVAERDPLTMIVSATPLPGEDGRPICVLMVLRDVTDAAHVQAKYQRLLQEEEEARASLEQRLMARTDALAKANAELTALHGELIALKKGLQVS